MNQGFFIQTFGCQMNERDSETLAGILDQLGFFQVETKEEARVAIINTCSVRENADNRFFGTLGRLKEAKEKDPAFVVCVCGCMMQQQHIVDTVKEKYPWVDIIFGTHNIHKFPELLEATLSETKKRSINAKGGIVDVWNDGEEIVEGLPAKRLYDHKAFVTIMYGCNNFCTYCIVPYTRGREKSRDPQEIIGEIQTLVKNGCKEVTLLGQNVNSYIGTDQSGNGWDIATLIRHIEKETGIERIRFMTSHPKDVSENLIQVYRDCKSLCDSIHLPVQSGSNKILAKMNRNYTAEEYTVLIKKVREARPNIGITTDLIVGFPGETEEDFEETLNLVKKVEFDAVFTFIYSPRKGTPAEGYKDQVDEEVKHQMFNRLVKEVNLISEKSNKARIGKIEKVLIESESKTKENMVVGRTSQFKPVKITVPKDIDAAQLIGKIANVEIIEASPFSLVGKV